MRSTFSAALLALALSACASIPVPTETLNAAELAVGRADASRAGDPSPPELRAARSKLAAAREAVASRKLRLATQLAEEARLDAELAATRIDASKAQFAVETLKKTNEALRQQALRNAVNVAPIAIPAPLELPAPDAPDALPATTP